MTSIRPARPEDAPAITELFRSTFPPERVEVLIHGCPGVAAYVAEHIALNGPVAELRFTVAEEDGQIVGCVEMRRGEPVNLNYIAVAPGAAGKGLGGRMLRAALEDFPAATSLSLDVWDDNSRAQEWYLRLGLQPVGATDWWALPPPRRDGEDLGTIRGWAHAAASHASYGFSAFDVSRGSNHTIGRLGDRWFRLGSPDAFRPWVLNTLALLDPQREILALLPKGSAEADTAASRRLFRSISMCGPVADVLRGLTQP